MLGMRGAARNLLLVFSQTRHPQIRNNLFRPMSKTMQASSSKKGVADRESKASDELTLLATEWSRSLLSQTDSRDAAKVAKVSFEAAVHRTIPFLSGGAESASTVPFLCRYRTEVVDPLTTDQVHLLRECVDRHETLRSLRARALKALDEHYGQGVELGKLDEEATFDEYREVRRRMLVCTSRSELEELYSPYKPPAKGSLAERIASAHPEIVDLVERFWIGELDYRSDGMKNILRKSQQTKNKNSSDMSPRECAVNLLATKVASNPLVYDTALGIARRECTISTKGNKGNKTADKKGSAKRTSQGSGSRKAARESNRSKYEQYFDFSSRALNLKDHQVLAIRRGVTAKELKMSTSLPDTDFVKRRIRGVLLDSVLPRSVNEQHHQSGAIRGILSDVIDDAWSRLLRRRCTTAVWREKVSDAERRGIAVFSENVRNALMAPPQPKLTHILAMDPGHRAGTKVALLNPRGEPLNDPRALSTVHFLDGKKEEAVSHLVELLKRIKQDRDKCCDSSFSSSSNEPIVVALGNGHGSDDSRALIEKASSQCSIPIEVIVVDEAGASVWSVTKSAEEEFPGKAPASIGAVSIGRRVQDPMNELVKVPPKSLGLGMYQHDLPEKDLEESLSHASIDAVAFVGVDGNSCSLELLRKVPGLSKRNLAEAVVEKRPLRSREDLKKVRGLGCKTFENCAAFVRMRAEDAREVLDTTRVHPESYPIARWLMKTLKCDLRSFPENLPTEDGTEKKGSGLVRKAAELFSVSPSRVESVVDQLHDAVKGVDPRLLRESSSESNGVEGNAFDKCSRLPADLAVSLIALKQATPVRNVCGLVRNVTDFGAFVDFGGETNGLLHVSQIGPAGLKNLHVGKRIGVDVISVCSDTRRVSLSLAGLGFEAANATRPAKKRKASNVKPRATKKRRR